MTSLLSMETIATEDNGQRGDTQESCSAHWVGCVILVIVKKRKVRLFGHMVRSKEHWQPPACRVKSMGKDHEEGQQDSGLTM